MEEIIRLCMRLFLMKSFLEVFHFVALAIELIVCLRLVYLTCLTVNDGKAQCQSLQMALLDHDILLSRVI